MPHIHTITRSSRVAHLATLGAAAILILTINACGGGLYDLPAPPPQDQWESTSADPAEAERASQRRYLAARSALLQFYRALSQEDWDAAWALMSTETQNFLNFTSANGDGKEALAQSRFNLPNGTTAEISPIDLFVVSDLRRLEDDYQGQAQAETANRKEIFAISEDGDVNKVVLIYETGRWVIHRTKAR